MSRDRNCARLSQMKPGRWMRRAMTRRWPRSRRLQRSIRFATRRRRRLKPFSRPNSCRSWPTCSRKPGSNNRTTRARPRTIRKNHSSKIESFPEWGGSGIAATLISFYAAAFSPPLSKTALTFSAKRSRCSGFCLSYTAWQAIAPSRRASKTHPAGMFMTGKNTAAFGIYHSRKDAEFAVDTLRAEGFRNTDISVLFAEHEGTKDFATEKHTKAPEGAATGATTGRVIGGVLGWLVGLGTLAVPGVGRLIAAGRIVAALTGAGVGGAVGGIAGALIGMGIPEYEAKRYEGRIKEGGILLSVHCDNSKWTKKAKDTLERTGAVDTASTGEAHADWHRTDKPLPRAS